MNSEHRSIHFNMKNNKYLAWLLLSILTLIWGSAFYLIVIGNRAFSGYEVGAYRIFVGFLILIPLSIRTYKNVPKKDWSLLLFCGVLGSLFPAILFSLAEKSLSSSTAGILSSLTPMFTFLIGLVLFKAEGKLMKFVGVVVGFSGAVFLAINTGEGSVSLFKKETLYIVVATFCYGLNLNILKHKFKHLSGLTIASNSLVFVGMIALGMLTYSGFWQKAFLPENRTPLLAITTLGALATGLAIVLFNQLVKVASALFSSSITYLIPLVASAIGYFIGGESIGYAHFVSTGVILIGVYLISRK